MPKITSYSKMVLSWRAGQATSCNLPEVTRNLASVQMRLALIQYSPLQQQPQHLYASDEVAQGQNDTKGSKDRLINSLLIIFK